MAWKKMDLKDLTVRAGWRYDDQAAAMRLAASVRKHGQLRALVVRTAPTGDKEVIRGRRVLAAMTTVGLDKAWVVDLGALSDAESALVELSMEIGFEVDYAQLALAVTRLLSDMSPDEVSGLSPFSAERIGYFKQLSTFDWSMYDPKSTGQEAFGFGGDGEPIFEDAWPVVEPPPPVEIPVAPVVVVEPVVVEPLPEVVALVEEPIVEPVVTEDRRKPVSLPGQAALF